MANHKSAEKRNRQNIKRGEVNRVRVSRIRTFLNGVENAIKSGNKAAAETAFKAAQPELMRGVSRGVFKLNTASRKLSRLSKRIKALAS